MTTNTINIEMTRYIEEIELKDNIRILHYSQDGYAYWYKGEEKSVGTYDHNKWFNIRKRFSKKYNESVSETFNSAGQDRAFEINRKHSKFYEKSSRKENNENN